MFGLFKNKSHPPAPKEAISPKNIWTKMIFAVQCGNCNSKFQMADLGLSYLELSQGQAGVTECPHCKAKNKFEIKLQVQF